MLSDGIGANGEAIQPGGGGRAGAKQPTYCTILAINYLPRALALAEIRLVTAIGRRAQVCPRRIGICPKRSSDLSRSSTLRQRRSSALRGF